MSILECFYSTPRVGSFRLSDGGGPFGFDITVACQIDHLVREGQLDGVVETGSFVGDTLEYFARRHPRLPVVGIEIDPQYAAIAAQRCAPFPNVTVRTGDSADLLAEAVKKLRRPLVYLDAHWERTWPLAAELAILERGVVAIDDFDIGHPRFGYDQYGDLRLDARLLHTLRDDLTWYYGAPEAVYPHPCLQIGRRTGTAYAAMGSVNTSILDHPYFLPAVLEGTRRPQHVREQA